MRLELDGKRALVTGSSSGIGEAIAKRLASEGARVVVHGRNVERAQHVAAAIRATGAEAHVAIGNLMDDGQAKAVADAAEAALGGDRYSDQQRRRRIVRSWAGDLLRIDAGRMACHL